MQHQRCWGRHHLPDSETPVGNPDFLNEAAAALLSISSTSALTALHSSIEEYDHSLNVACGCLTLQRQHIRRYTYASSAQGLISSNILIPIVTIVLLAIIASPARVVPVVRSKAVGN